jgi:DNA-binding transcriptional MerR regulator
MTVKEVESEKLFYSIGEVAEMFDVNASLIRFWEKEFDIIKPRKNAKGNRMFTKQDVDNFRLIYHLVKERGFTLQGAREKLKGGKIEEENTNVEIVRRLEAVKGFLLELKAEL